MVSFRVVFTKQAQKDAKKIARTNLKARAEGLLKILREDPFRSPPPFEALVGDLKGACSHRINIQRRIVYQVLEEQRVVKVIRRWTHQRFASLCLANSDPRSCRRCLQSWAIRRK